MPGEKTITNAINNSTIVPKITDSASRLDSIDSKTADQHVVSNNGSVAAASNSAGLTVSLDKTDKFHVNVYYSVGGAAEIYVEVSSDNTTWRLLDKIVTTAAKSDIEQYPWVVYPYIRVRSPTTGIDIEFEIVAK